MKYYYCPVCGIIAKEHRSSCNDCHSNIATSESLYDKEYYNQEAIKIYGDKRMKLQILLSREVRTNPLYSHEANKKAWEEFDTKFNEKIENLPPLEPINIPKCPTCNSTNIKKLSFINRYLHYRAIGFLSKTARSQFVCNNCGYKW